MKPIPHEGRKTKQLSALETIKIQKNRVKAERERVLHGLIRAGALDYEARSEKTKANEIDTNDNSHDTDSDDLWESNDQNLDLYL